MRGAFPPPVQTFSLFCWGGGCLWVGWGGLPFLLTSLVVFVRFAKSGANFYSRPAVFRPRTKVLPRRSQGRSPSCPAALSLRARLVQSGRTIHKNHVYVRSFLLVSIQRLCCSGRLAPWRPTMVLSQQVVLHPDGLPPIESVKAWYLHTQEGYSLNDTAKDVVNMKGEAPGRSIARRH